MFTWFWFFSNYISLRPGCWILDPFVGSGSLLVPAAKFGAYVSGSDLDRQMLHGKSKPTRVHQKVRASDESIMANLKQYNCEQLYVDILVSDFSLPIWHDNLQFDAIITDPPYGIREATEKIVAKSGRKSTVLAEDTVHYPSTSPYQLNHLFFDLMMFGAKHLRLGGRLVFWFPVYLEEYSDDLLPKHKCMRLIANSENPLSSFSSRRLLTFEKVSDDFELSEEERKQFVNLQNFRER
jgi:tRNA (guanine10-N2)-methyltransferase